MGKGLSILTQPGKNLLDDSQYHGKQDQREKTEPEHVSEGPSTGAAQVLSAYQVLIALLSSVCGDIGLRQLDSYWIPSLQIQLLTSDEESNVLSQGKAEPRENMSSEINSRLQEHKEAMPACTGPHLRVCLSFVRKK